MFPEMKKGLLLAIIFVGGCLTLYGQSSRSYSEILETRKQGVYSNHSDSYIAQILTGSKVWDHEIDHQQLFLDKPPVRGSLVYDGVLFNDIELQYNLSTQQVIVLLETEISEGYVTVTIDKASRFSVYDHEFVQVLGDSVMEKGIYELAYAGANSNVFIKRTNKRLKSIQGSQVNTEYYPVNKYYISNEFGTFHITSKKQLLEAYQHSRQLISILKKYRIKLSKRKIEQSLIAAISNFEAETASNNI
ncbi:MAG: hypothetical protein DHS20C17_29040 [Cyclobacteriaceae bacterium]|nr:MAG: hypothetical protein DHS20C17_29040 [Cyclobacteriaceae bacterium]